MKRIPAEYHMERVISRYDIAVVANEWAARYWRLVQVVAEPRGAFLLVFEYVYEEQV